MRHLLRAILYGLLLSGCIQPDATIHRLMKAEGMPARRILHALDSIPDASKLGDEDWHAYLYLRAKARYELKRIKPKDTTLVQTMAYFDRKGKPAQAGLLALCAGRAYTLARNYEQALYYAMEAERLAHRTGNCALMLSVYYERGNLYSQIGDAESSFFQFEKMMHLMKEHPEMQERLSSGNLFLDAGNALLYLNCYKEAAEWLGMMTDNTLNSLDSTTASYALYRMAYALHMLKRQQESMAYARRSLIYATHRRERLRGLLLLADIFQTRGQTDSLTAMLSQAKQQLTSENPIGKANYYWQLTELLRQRGNDNQALDALLQYEHIMDTLTVPRARLRVDKFRGHYEQMQAEMRYLRDMNRWLLVFCASLAVIFLLGILAYSLYRRARNRLQRCREAEECIEHLNSLLIERTETLQDMLVDNLQFMRKLTQIQSCSSDKNLSFLQRLNNLFFEGQQKPMDNRQKICNAVDFLYDSFRSRLASTHPELTDQEIELCCLMRAGLETKEIAVLTEQSVYSIQKRRTSIRKKLNMEEGADIIRFLESTLAPSDKNDLLLSPLQP